jgi:hypothetical protein
VLLDARIARNSHRKLKQPNSAFGLSTDRAPSSLRSVRTSARNAKLVRKPIPSLVPKSHEVGLLLGL